MTPQRREPGIRRRLRIFWVRELLWEKANPEVRVGHGSVTYAHPWESRNALTKWNPSCTCRTCKGARYSRKVKHPSDPIRLPDER